MSSVRSAKWCLVFLVCYLAVITTGLSIHHTSPHHHNHHNHHNHLHQNNKHHGHHTRNGRSRFSKLDQILDRLHEDSNADNYPVVSGNGVGSDDVKPKNEESNNDTFTTERWMLPVLPTSEHQIEHERDLRRHRLTQDNPAGDVVIEDGNNEGDDSEDDDEDDDEDDEEEVLDGNGDIGNGQESDPMDTQADTETRRRGSLSEMKWRALGSKTEVDKMFINYRHGVHFNQHYDNNSSDKMEALLHSMKMSRETACKVPKAKIIRVADKYPSSSKYYLPACTILHQCAEDAGCCTGAQKCGAKSTKRVILYFNTVSYDFLGKSRSYSMKPTYVVEKLTFYNHTECECQDPREEEMPRDSGALQRAIDMRLNLPETNCRCPSEYTVRHLANGSCICDCFDKQRDCIKYKKGNEYFNHRDRLCIEMETCLQPSCDFGVYLRRSGRCPRKHEKFRTWSRYT